MDAPLAVDNRFSPYLTNELKIEHVPKSNEAEIYKLDAFTTPCVIIHDYNPNDRNSRGLITAGLVHEAAKFTLKSFNILRHDSYFLAGLRAFLAPDHGPLLGLGKMLGIAGMAIGILFGIRDVVVGGGGIVVGAAATTVSAVACVGEVAIRKASNAFEPSEPVKAREELTQRFITRMEEATKGMLPKDRQFYKDNLSHLVNMAVLQVAFLSRKENGDCLQVSGQTFPHERVMNLDRTCQQYFNDIIDMKLALQKITGVMKENNDDLAWEILKRDLSCFDETNSVNMSEKTFEAVDNLVFSMHAFSKKLNQDPVYTRLIRASSLA